MFKFKRNRPLRDKLELPKQDWESIKKYCNDNNTLFEDPEFPAENASIFYSKPVPGRIKWVRPKEMVKNPVFVEKDASRFDIVQGSLGDCWLLAAVASLTTEEELFKKVVPTEQGFEGENYFGAFRFMFWHYGEFKEVIVDDRLATVDGELMFMHSATKNEFWSALFEKAYAKMCGCYQALDGGSAVEAFIDFTGGIGERFQLEGASYKLFSTLHEASMRDSLMSCAIIGQTLEGRLPNGLVVLHAYSITGLREVTISKLGRKVQLLRIRNPWGEVEWNGAWSDNSAEWRLVSKEEKQELHLNYKNDGEFWMDWRDFSSNFSIVEVCNLHADSITDSVLNKWKLTQFNGSWVKHISAGGNLKSKSFNSNPTFTFEIEKSDNPQTEVLISVSQKDRRRLFSQGKTMLPIAFHVYENVGGRLRLIGGSGPYTNKREVSKRLDLRVGKYSVIASTYEVNTPGEFLLRIFSEGDTKKSEDHVEEVAIQEKDDIEDIFREAAGVDMELDTADLQKLLNSSFDFSWENTAHLISLYDQDGSGSLGFEEFKDLWGRIDQAKTIFNSADSDNSGSLSTFELKRALRSAGFVVSTKTVMSLVLKHSDKDGTLSLDDFVVCIVKIARCSAVFKRKAAGQATARFTLNQFMEDVCSL